MGVGIYTYDMIAIATLVFLDLFFFIRYTVYKNSGRWHMHMRNEGLRVIYSQHSLILVLY